MSVDRRADPYRTFNFLVQLDGVASGGFAEVSGLEAGTDPPVNRPGADPRPGGRRNPAPRRGAVLSMKRGLMRAALLDDWRGSGTARRRTVTVILCDEHRRPLRRWQLASPWISKVEGQALQATGNDLALDKNRGNDF